MRTRNDFPHPSRQAAAAWAARCGALAVLLLLLGLSGCIGRVRVSPQEQEDAVLHNPDMGWVLLENYPLDPDPDGTSTLAALPGEDFPQVDHVALMFSWADVETSGGVYDFTRVNHAYDHWRARGKHVHLRMSAEALLWWPNSGRGVPRYVLDALAPEERQTRQAFEMDYTVVDARNAHYRECLARFLGAVSANFSGDRSVGLIDLRGFGLWGEWHSGFRYPTFEERRASLCGILDLFSYAFPRHQLALSYSYDPDAPPETWSGTTASYDPDETRHYDEYVRFSAFDHALTRPNITFRRDGCGGTVHSNERKFMETAFSCLGKGPFTCEFFDGYRFFSGGDPWWNADRALDDALSLHPNYIVIMGWQAHEALQFVRERPDLVARGLREMGYRLVPITLSWPRRVRSDRPFSLRSTWVNRGKGRAVADYTLEILLKDEGGQTIFRREAGKLGTSGWVKDRSYRTCHEIPGPGLPGGDYSVFISVLDPRTGLPVKLPVAGEADGAYPAGRMRVE